MVSLTAGPCNPVTMIPALHAPLYQALLILSWDVQIHQGRCVMEILSFHSDAAIDQQERWLSQTFERMLRGSYSVVDLLLTHLQNVAVNDWWSLSDYRLEPLLWHSSTRTGAPCQPLSCIRCPLTRLYGAESFQPASPSQPPPASGRQSIPTTSHMATHTFPASCRPFTAIRKRPQTPEWVPAYAACPGEGERG